MPDRPFRFLNFFGIALVRATRMRNAIAAWEDTRRSYEVLRANFSELALSKQALDLRLSNLEAAERNWIAAERRLVSEKQAAELRVNQNDEARQKLVEACERLSMEKQLMVEQIAAADLALKAHAETREATALAIRVMESRVTEAEAARRSLADANTTLQSEKQAATADLTHVQTAMRDLTKALTHFTADKRGIEKRLKSAETALASAKAEAVKLVEERDIAEARAALAAALGQDTDDADQESSANGQATAGEMPETKPAEPAPKAASARARSSMRAK